MRPLSGDFVSVISPVPINWPPSPGQNFGIGNAVKSISSPTSTTSLTGASCLATWVGLMGCTIIERVAAIISAVDRLGLIPTASAYRSLLAPSILLKILADD